jgi:NADH-quinone oxidoreductase subunit H
MFIIIENLKFFIFFLSILGIYYIISIILAVAYLTLYERKLLASMQKRKGPNVVGILGLLQPIADAFKLIVKESIIPQHSNVFLFFICPFMTFVLSITAWFVIPLSSFSIISNINIGILYIFMISSLNALNIIIAGWSSNSRYAFLGSLRSISQVIAYEVVIGIILINIIAFTGSLNFLKVVIAQKCNIWFIFVMPAQFLLFLIAMLAETNRHPFDLAEAESELVSGYNVEHSSILFALFFLAEYANIILLCNINVLLFLGGWTFFPSFKSFIPFIYPDFYLNDLQIRTLNIYTEFNIYNILIYLIKFHIILFFFIWIRATLPRYRYDQLMRLGWKVFVPLTLGLYILFLGLVIFFNSIPNKQGFIS